MVPSDFASSRWYEAETANPDRELHVLLGGYALALV